MPLPAHFGTGSRGTIKIPATQRPFLGLVRAGLLDPIHTIVEGTVVHLSEHGHHAGSTLPQRTTMTGSEYLAIVDGHDPRHACGVCVAEVPDHLADSIEENLDLGDWLFAADQALARDTTTSTLYDPNGRVWLLELAVLVRVAPTDLTVEGAGVVADAVALLRTRFAQLRTPAWQFFCDRDLLVSGRLGETLPDLDSYGGMTMLDLLAAGAAPEDPAVYAAVGDAAAATWEDTTWVVVSNPVHSALFWTAASLVPSVGATGAPSWEDSLHPLPDDSLYLLMQVPTTLLRNSASGSSVLGAAVRELVGSRNMPARVVLDAIGLLDVGWDPALDAAEMLHAVYGASLPHPAGATPAPPSR